MQQLFGGSSGGSSNQSSSQSGFSLLPPSLQQAFTQYAGDVNSATSNPAALTAAFTPQNLNAGATSSLQSLSNGTYSPTASNISNAMSSVTNPYMADVINPTEQAAYGADSALSSSLNAAGQFGSNRATLGANNIANQEAATIGGLEGNQFNSSMSDVLNQILPGQQTSAGLSVGAGQTQQQIALQQAMAPYTALSAYSQLLGAIPQSGGSTSQGTSSSQNSASNSIFSQLFGGG